MRSGERAFSFQLSAVSFEGGGLRGGFGELRGLRRGFGDLRGFGRAGRCARRGFTLIELMIVMAIIVILVGVAIPHYQKSIQSAKETVLHNNLSAMRNAIDEYSYDKQSAPHTLSDLVTGGYLRDVPKDPITGSNDSWKIIMEDASQSVNSTDPGIFDVRSGSAKTGLDGTAYSEW